MSAQTSIADRLSIPSPETFRAARPLACIHSAMMGQLERILEAYRDTEAARWNISKTRERQECRVEVRRVLRRAKAAKHAYYVALGIWS
jgi:hypothetical protein